MRWRRTDSRTQSMFPVYGLAEASLAVSFPAARIAATLHHGRSPRARRRRARCASSRRPIRLRSSSCASVVRFRTRASSSWTTPGQVVGRTRSATC